MKSLSVFFYVTLGIAVGLMSGWFVFSNATPKIPKSDHPEIHTSKDQEEWICSMHPQIRQNEPGLCPICEMDLIPAGSNESDDPLVLQMTASAVKLAHIQTSVIGSSSSEQEGRTIRLSGKVKADERLASSQVAHVSGRIEKLYVAFTGEQVSSGQKLADIYSPDLIAAQRELLEALKLQAINPNLIKAARDKLRFWKIPNSTISGIEENGKIQEVFPLFATESGIVTNRRVAVGDYLKKGEPLFDLINLKKVWVMFDAYEENLANIKIGNRIEFKTPTFPNKTFKARITFIDPLINPQTRTASVRTEVDNVAGQLKPEMFVQGIIKQKPSSKSQLTVPKSAVLWTGTRSVVYVKVPDMDIPSFKFKEIEIGESMGNGYQVLNGLESGEEVVTYGSFTIDAAAQLNNQASMMNREVKIKEVDQIVQLPDYTEATPKAFKQQLAEVSDAYLLLKDALVATNNQLAKTTAQQYLRALSKIEMSLVTGDAHQYWMEQQSALQSHGEKITELTDVEKQRKQFDVVSETLIRSLKVFGISDKTLFVQYCPMAFDNEGADWLSNVEAIQNPYFGDKMMKCGKVKLTLDPEFKNRMVTIKNKK